MTITIRSFLEQHGLPGELELSWRRRGITAWTPLQARAWRQGMAAGREHALVLAPTSAGKSLLAEAVAAVHLARREKVLWLTSTRALARGAAASLEASFAPLGLRLARAWGDCPQDRARINHGRFDLMVGVYERAASWLMHHPHALARVGLVVVDELGMLRDPQRGGPLDLLLTQIMTSPYTPRRLGLGLPGDGGPELAGWWGGELLIDQERPLTLREGVFDRNRGQLHWRPAGQPVTEVTDDPAAAVGFSLDQAQCEPLFGPGELARMEAALGGELDPAEEEEALDVTLAVAAALARRGEPTLLFAPTRAQARRWARVLAQGAGLPPAGEEALEAAGRLAQADPCADHQQLLEVARAGVGVHHADLSAAARAWVEESFQAGCLPLLVATPTLAQGVNLTARNVVHWPWSVGAGGQWRALERWRWANQGGRAARLGQGHDFGRSILVARGSLQARRLWGHFLERPAEPMRSALGAAEVAGGVLAPLATAVARTPGNLHEFFTRTFASHAAPEAMARWLPGAIDKGLDLAGRLGMMQPPGEQDDLRLAPQGRIALAHGVPMESWRVLDRWAGAGWDPPAGPDGELVMLWAAALAAPAGMWPCPESLRHLMGMRPQVERWFEERSLAMPGPLAQALEGGGAMTPAVAGALMAGWRLRHWICGLPTPQAERASGWSAGMMAKVGAGLAWLAWAMAARLEGAGARDQAALWRALACRLPLGLPAGLEALGRVTDERVSRADLLRLGREGLDSPQALVQAGLEAIGALTGDPLAAQGLLRWAQKELNKQAAFPAAQQDWSQPLGTAQSDPAAVLCPPAPAGKEAADPRAGAPLSLQIDLSSPGIVRSGPREARLNGYGFDLLAALAERPGQVVTRQALYHRLWPEEGPEEQQLDTHRRHLCQALEKQLGPLARGTIEVIRGVGFRLKMPPEQVCLIRG